MTKGKKTPNGGQWLTALFFIAGLLFILIAVYVRVDPQNAFDRSVQGWFHPLATKEGLQLFIRITFFGSFEFLFPAYMVFILICIWQKKARYGLSVAGVALGGFLSEQLLKQVFQRHRPLMPLIPNVVDYSFPSGHTASSFIFCAVLTYSFWQASVSRPLRIAGLLFFGMLTLSIGLSRIILTAHYPTDVVAGFCFGMLWVIAWYRFVRKKIYRRLPVFPDAL